MRKCSGLKQILFVLFLSAVVTRLRLCYDLGSAMPCKLWVYPADLRFSW